MAQFGVLLCRLSYLKSPHPNKDPLWSNLLYYFHYYFSIKLLVIVYHQYVFDYHKYKLDKFDLIANQTYTDGYLTPRQVECKELFRDHLVDGYEQARDAYKSIGAPFMHFNYIIENGLIYLILWTECVYLQPQYYYRFCRPFDYGVIDILLAPLRLQALTDRLIANRVNNFIVSSRTYEVLRMAENRQESGRCSDSTQRQHCEVSRKDEIIFNSNPSNHKFLVEEAKSMAASGILQPLNRREDRIDKLSDMYGLLFIIMLPSLIGSLMLFELAIPYMNVFGAEIEAGAMDYIIRVELAIYSITGPGAVCTYVAGVIMICVDQVHLVSRLGCLIDNCIRHNTYDLLAFLKCDRNYSSPTYFCDIELRDHGSSEPDAESSNHPSHSVKTSDFDEAIYERVVQRSINRSLLNSILHYKIFVKQLRCQFSTIQIFSTMALIVTLAGPIMTRLLIAYLDRKRQTLSVLGCLIVLLFTDLALGMVCWLHGRCLCIYRHMQSLMAHTVEMDHIAEMRIGRKAFDEHLIRMLYRELGHPDRLVDQFSTQILGGQINVTYPSLIKVHFWLGILFISIMVIDPTLPNAADIFGGVWRFYSGADADLERFFYDLSSL